MVIISNFATCSHNILEILLVSYESFIISIIVNYILFNRPTKKDQVRNNFSFYLLSSLNTTIDIGW
jgi:hypothetical protein